MKLPRVGLVRTHQNTRRLERLLCLGRARLLNVMVRRRGARLLAVFQVQLVRPQCNVRPTRPESIVGVDAGVRRLATVANRDGEVIERVAGLRAIDQNLSQLRRLHRAQSRCQRGSVRYRRRTYAISAVSARIASQRSDAIHRLTTRLAKAHGTVVVESLSVSGTLGQKHIPGARARRRGLADASMSQLRRQLSYKCTWYGSVLIETDAYYPSSRVCNGCGVRNEPGWRTVWICVSCGIRHDRDDNAAINLALYCEGDMGAVGTPDKRGAERRTRAVRAAGSEATKESSGLPAETQPGHSNLVRGARTGG